MFIFVLRKDYFNVIVLRNRFRVRMRYLKNYLVCFFGLDYIMVVLFLGNKLLEVF